jgi:hypothetical protein
MKILNKSKRAQEEMVGFVLIIVIVAVIGLFFMFIMSKQAKPYTPSSEIESFLQSSLIYTTSCYPEQGASPYNLQYLAEACSNSKICNNGEDSCSILNKTISELLESSFNINQESKYKAYRFNIYEYGESMLSLEKGNLTGNLYGAEVKFYTSSGSMNMTLKLYF